MPKSPPARIKVEKIRVGIRGQLLVDLDEVEVGMCLLGKIEFHTFALRKGIILTHIAL